MKRRGDEEMRARDRALSGAEKHAQPELRLVSTSLDMGTYWNLDLANGTFVLLKCPLMRLVFEQALLRSERVCVALNRLCARSPEHSCSVVLSAYILPMD